MSSLIGIYGKPDPERIEQDDEARRTIAKALGEGAEIIGTFGCDEERRRCVAEEASRRAWHVAGKKESGDE